MVSNTLKHNAYASQPRTRLQKESTRSGFILWLRKRVDEHDLILLEAAGLPKRALNHPVVVVDMLEKDPEHVKICTMTSCGNRNIMLSKIDRKHWHSYLPVHPTPSHPPYITEPLSLEDNIQLRKLSYIDTRHTYRVSLVLLKEYDDLEKEMSSHRLTPKSMETVRTACSLTPSPKRKPHHPGTDTMPKIPPITPRPTSNQHVYNHLQAAAAPYNVEGTAGRYRVPVDEHEPLLPIPVTSRSQNSQAQFPPAWQFQSRSHHGLAVTDYYDAHRRPHKTDRQPILSALLTFLCLCACVMLLAGLSYSLFLGITWVFRIFMILGTTIKVELVRLGHYIAHIAGIVASPFTTVREAISAGWRNVVHVLKEIMRWFGRQNDHV